MAAEVTVIADDDAQADDAQAAAMLAVNAAVAAGALQP